MFYYQITDKWLYNRGNYDLIDCVYNEICLFEKDSDVLGNMFRYLLF